MSIAQRDVARPGAADPFDLFRLWRADLFRYRPPNTAKRYARTGFAAAADLPPAGSPIEWTRADLSRFLRELNPAHAKLVRQALMDWLDWCVRHGHRAENPLETLEPVKRAGGRRIRRALSQDELTRLVVAIAWCSPARPDWIESRRRIALMAIAQYRTGLRPGELCKLTNANVRLDVEHPHVEVVGTKTGDDRLVPLSAKAQEVFRELLEDRVGKLSNRNERSYSQVVSRAGAMIGLPKGRRHPYCLRHTFATTMIEAGVPARVVADLMGHRDMRTIGLYTVPSDPALRAAVETLP